MKLLMLILLSFQLLAMEDARQFVGGTLEEIEPEFDSGLDKETDESSGFLTGTAERIEDEELEFDPLYMPSKKRDTSIMDKEVDERIYDYGHGHQGEYDKSQSYLEFKNAETLRSVRDLGSYEVSFGYLQDTFDYENARGTFDDTLTNNYSLQITAHYFLKKGTLDFLIGTSTVIGYHYGTAKFVNGEFSETTLKLWTLPLDLSFGTEVNLSHYLKLGLYAGPSALFLFQNRSDLVEGDSRKTHRQMGYGYFARGILKFSLTHLWQETSFALYRSQQITSYYFYLDARIQNYDGFKEDVITVSGSSIGAGFSFEFF